MEEVTLRIGDKIFKASRELLCEYSDYFRAMFSGFYIESEKQEINIDMLDPNVMDIILKYMKLGMILLSEYPLSTIGEIAIAANFLQITELVKQIQYVLETQLNESNWVEIMMIAQNASYTELEQYSAAYGLYSFNSMKPEYIPSIHKLAWYLCHPYLDSQSEFHVFKFGFEWLVENKRLEDMLLIVACLDIKRITIKNLLNIKQLLSHHTNYFFDSLVTNITDCLLELISKDIEISEKSLWEYKTVLLEKYSDSFCSNLMSIVKSSRTRLLKRIPVAPLWTLKGHRPDFIPHSLYTFNEDKGFEHYLEVAEKNLWGYNVAAWGLTKIVIVGGEYGRGTGIFNRDVKVYDTLKKEWTQFGVQLPARRHAGVTTVGDFLYMVGGVGEFRVVLETALVYDLRERSHQLTAELPDAIQSPAVCTHNDKVYAAGQKNIYCLNTTAGDKDYWNIAAESDIRMTFMRSYDNYIYCMQSYFSRLYRFKPGKDDRLYCIASFSHVPAALFNLGDCLMVFTRTESDELTVETYKGDSENEEPKVLPVRTTNKRVNDVAGACSLVMTMPPLFTDLPEYHRQYLVQHSNT